MGAHNGAQYRGHNVGYAMEVAKSSAQWSAGGESESAWVYVQGYACVL